MKDRLPDGYEFLEDADGMLIEEFIYEYNLSNSIRSRSKRRSVQAQLYRNALRQVRPEITRLLDLCEQHYVFIGKLKGDL